MELSLDTGAQRFVYGHTAAVTTLAHSEEQASGASGQVLLKVPKSKAKSQYAEVLLWDATTLQVVATFLYHKDDIEAVGFAQEGEVLITVGGDPDRTLAVWAAAREGWFRVGRREKTPLLVCSAYKGGGVHGVLAAPAAAKPSSPSQFITFGVQHVKFWQLQRLSPALEGRRGAFGSKGARAPRTVVCAAFAAPERLVVGGADGEIFFFEGTRAVRQLRLVNFGVALLVPLSDALLVAYSHGVVSLLRGNTTEDMDIAGLPGAPDSRLQTPIAGGATWQQRSLLLASKTNLLAVDLSPSCRPQSCAVLLAQPSRTLTAVAMHSTEPRFFTGSLDGGVRCYRCEDARPIPERNFRSACGVTCLAVSQAGTAPDSSAWLAVGCEDSTLSILGETTYHFVFRRVLSKTKSKLTCAKFSPADPAGSPLWLAVGSEDGFIYIFRFKEAYCKSTVHTGAEVVEKVDTLRGHAASVIDVSFPDVLPCTCLLSTDAAGQMLAFDVNMGRRLPTVAMVRDMPFSPWSAPIGWAVQGCWTSQPVGAEAQLPNRCFIELKGKSAIAVSEPKGPSVEIFPFPCPSAPAAEPIQLWGPAVPIAALQFGACSECFVAASDAVLFLWTLKPQPVSASEPVAAVATPQRQARQAGAMKTPEVRKKSLSVGALTPQRRTPLKGARGVAAASASSKTPLTPQRHAGAPLGPLPAWGEAKPGLSESTSAVVSPRSMQAVRDLAQLAPLPSSPPPPAAPERPAVHQAAPPPAAPRPAEPPAWPREAWAIERPQEPATSPSPRRVRDSEPVSPKVGAEHRAAAALGLQEDSVARARSIFEKHHFDSVGQLIGGQPARGAAVVVAPRGEFQESAAGRFLYRAKETVERFEVEVRLPRGRLLRVLRNPLRRTLTFEGQVTGQRERLSGRQRAPTVDQEERLIVRIPPGFDLVGEPAVVHRDFESGRCFVVVENKDGRAGLARASSTGQLLSR